MGHAGSSAAQKLGLGLGVAIFGAAMAWAGLDGRKAAQGIAQPEIVITAIRAFYNWIPMVLSIILFVTFVIMFHLEHDMEELSKEKRTRRRYASREKRASSRGKSRGEKSRDED